MFVLRRPLSPEWTAARVKMHIIQWLIFWLPYSNNKSAG